ncbi:hypothetical protein IT417_00020 [bacterium]|nr:hypothetical protein [bacterium]
MATEAKRVVTLDDIKFNKDNALLAVVACIPMIAVVVFLVEKKDLFVRYYAAQFSVITLVLLVLSLVVCIAPFVNLIGLILTIMAALKAYKGERWDIPNVSKFALDLVNKY